MGRRWTQSMLLTLSLLAVLCTQAVAAPGGVQWSPDGLHLYVTKDVGAERWSITLNLQDGSVAGNIFFTDARPPAFVFCPLTGHNHEAEAARLILHFQCFGSDAAQGVFAINDWNLIADDVQLSAAFFGPPPETCDLSGVSNGPDAAHASSGWECGGPSGTFALEVFDDGTGISSAIGPFTFSGLNGCGFGVRGDGAFFNAAYSPSRDVLNLFETDPSVTRFVLSECHRTVF